MKDWTWALQRISSEVLVYGRTGVMLDVQSQKGRVLGRAWILKSGSHLLSRPWYLDTSVNSRKKGHFWWYFFLRQEILYRRCYLFNSHLKSLLEQLFCKWQKQLGINGNCDVSLLKGIPWLVGTTCTVSSAVRPIRFQWENELSWLGTWWRLKWSSSVLLIWSIWSEWLSMENNSSWFACVWLGLLDFQWPNFLRLLSQVEQLHRKKEHWFPHLALKRRITIVAILDRLRTRLNAEDTEERDSGLESFSMFDSPEAILKQRISEQEKMEQHLRQQVNFLLQVLVHSSRKKFYYVAVLDNQPTQTNKNCLLRQQNFSI